MNNLTIEQCTIILQSLNTACKAEVNVLAAAQVYIPVAMKIEQIQQAAINAKNNIIGTHPDVTDQS